MTFLLLYIFVSANITIIKKNQILTYLFNKGSENPLIKIYHTLFFKWVTNFELSIHILFFFPPTYRTWNPIFILYFIFLKKKNIVSFNITTFFKPTNLVGQWPLTTPTTPQPAYTPSTPPVTRPTPPIPHPYTSIPTPTIPTPKTYNFRKSDIDIFSHNFLHKTKN